MHHKIQLTCDNMNEATRPTAHVSLQEQGPYNDIVLNIDGITVAWLSPDRGLLITMNLSREEATKLERMGFRMDRGQNCAQLKMEKS